MIGESRTSPSAGPLSAGQIEHELARLRMSADGSPGLRASVLNLIVVADEESSGEATRAISELAGQYPSRTILLISDPEGEDGVDVRLAAFCSTRGGSRTHICAEQIKIHAGGAPARHLESLADPLLIPDLPTFLWYPGPFSADSPEFAAMAELAGRLIVDSAAAEDCGASLRGLAALLDEPGRPALGDLQWTALSPWRALLADLFDSPERAEALRGVRRVEILHSPQGECRALLLVGWLASALGWEPRHQERENGELEISLSGPSGDVAVVLSPGSPDARLRRVRLLSGDLSFQVSRHRTLSSVCTTVVRGGETVAERTVYVGKQSPTVLLEEELRCRGRDEAFEAALRTVAEVLDL